MTEVGVAGYRIREEGLLLTLCYESGNTCYGHDGQEITFSALGATPERIREAAEAQETYLAGLHETFTELYGRRERWTVGYTPLGEVSA